MLVDLVLGLVLRRELCCLAQLIAVPIGELALDDAPRRHLLELGIERLRAGLHLRRADRRRSGRCIRCRRSCRAVGGRRNRRHLLAFLRRRDAIAQHAHGAALPGIPAAAAEQRAATQRCPRPAGRPTCRCHQILARRGYDWARMCGRAPPRSSSREWEQGRVQARVGVPAWSDAARQAPARAAETEIRQGPDANRRNRDAK